MSLCRHSGRVVTVIDTGRPGTTLSQHGRGGEVSLSPSSAISAIYVFFSDPNSNLDETSPRGGPDFVAIELV